MPWPCYKERKKYIFNYLELFTVLFISKHPKIKIHCSGENKSGKARGRIRIFFMENLSALFAQAEPARLLVQLLTFEFLWLNPSSQYLESCLWLLKRADGKEAQRQHCCGHGSVSSEQRLHTFLHLSLARQRRAWCQAMRHSELARMQEQLIWSGPELHPHRLMTAWCTLAYSLTLGRNPFGRSNFPQNNWGNRTFLFLLNNQPGTRSAIIIKPQGPGTLEKQHRSNRLKVRKL